MLDLLLKLRGQIVSILANSVNKLQALIVLGLRKFEELFELSPLVRPLRLSVRKLVLHHLGVSLVAIFQLLEFIKKILVRIV